MLLSKKGGQWSARWVVDAADKGGLICATLGRCITKGQPELAENSSRENFFGPHRAGFHRQRAIQHRYAQRSQRTAPL